MLMRRREVGQGGGSGCGPEQLAANGSDSLYRPEAHTVFGCVLLDILEHSGSSGGRKILNELSFS